MSEQQSIDEKYMRMALREAMNAYDADEVPIGCVIVCQGQIIARGYNLVRGRDATSIAWSDELLERLVASALLGYLAVSHYGRGRGEWSESEHPAHWEEEHPFHPVTDPKHAYVRQRDLRRHRKPSAGRATRRLR